MALPVLPEKKYFKIGEVADLVGVEPHVLRYWETQFPQLRPHKARSGHRLYRRREVETLLVIRELLHVQRFTIAGARQALRQPGGATSLLPRFFEAPDGSIGSSRSELPGTVLPQSADLTDEGDGYDASDVDGDGEHVEVEVEGLEGEELRLALEHQAAARSPSGTIVEVEVEGVEVPPAAAAVVRPRIMPSLGLSPRKRGLIEDALGDARAILAILDREDAVRRPHA